MRHLATHWTLAATLLLAHPAAGLAPAADAVAAVLDDFHAAAAAADEERTFSHLAPTAVFLGTDAAERWDRAAFRAYAHPHFAQGKGWTFVPTERHIQLAPGEAVAWFDERLASARYGECRGTGVLVRRDGRWWIEQYNLTLPVPNPLAPELVERIRALAPAPPPGH